MIIILIKIVKKLLTYNVVPNPLLHCTSTSAAATYITSITVSYNTNDDNFRKKTNNYITIFFFSKRKRNE